jgi:hypothetical protein
VHSGCPSAGAIDFRSFFIALFFFSNYCLQKSVRLLLYFCSPFSFSFSVSFWLLILMFCFHNAFVFSMSILFHNAALNFICRSASHVFVSSSPAHQNCDVLSHWLPRDSHGIRRFANTEIIMMHKDLTAIWRENLH